MAAGLAGAVVGGGASRLLDERAVKRTIYLFRCVSATNVMIEVPLVFALPQSFVTTVRFIRLRRTVPRRAFVTSNGGIPSTPIPIFASTGC